MTNPTFRAVIFDHGGVLDYPTDKTASTENLENMAQSLDFSSGSELMHHIFGGEDWLQAEVGHISEDEFWSRRLSPLGIIAQADQRDFAQRLFSKHSAIHPQMRAMMVQLHKHYKVSVLSNTAIHEFQTWIEENTDVPKDIDLVVGSADIGLSKPDPAIFHYMLERLQVSPDETLFVDDTVQNLVGARQAGLQTVHFLTPEFLRSELIERGMLAPEFE